MKENKNYRVGDEFLFMFKKVTIHTVAGLSDRSQSSVIGSTAAYVEAVNDGAGITSGQHLEREMYELTDANIKIAETVSKQWERMRRVNYINTPAFYQRMGHWFGTMCEATTPEQVRILTDLFESECNTAYSMMDAIEELQVGGIKLLRS